MSTSANESPGRLAKDGPDRPDAETPGRPVTTAAECAAKQAPARLELRAKPRPVTRLNRKTIAALTGVLTLATLLAMTWGLRPQKPRELYKKQEQPTAERVTRPEGLATLPRDYSSIPRPAQPAIPQLGPPTGEFGQPIGRTPRDRTHRRFRSRPPSRYAYDESDATEIPDSAEAAKSANAPVFFQLAQRRQPGRSERPLSGAETRSDTSNSSAATDTRAVPDLQLTARPDAAQSAGAPDPKRALVARTTDSYTYATGTLQTPRSPNQLMAGTLIRAALVTGINSDLPGQIIATVVENVFDTITGRRLLIPQGSRLLGEYDNETTYGQRRVLLVWTRLIRPDGSSITLDRLPGIDAAGYAGLEDQVDWHSKRLVTGAAVSSLLGIGAELATPQRSGPNGGVVVATRDSLHDTVNEVGQEITKRNLDIRPTLTIRPGFPVQVIINKDLIL